MRPSTPPRPELLPGAALRRICATYAAELGALSSDIAAGLLTGIALARSHPEYAQALFAATPDASAEALLAVDDIVTAYPIAPETPPCITGAATGEDR